ncbi:hypothetical protein BJX99DRAFT_263461 [Aspergillus californicus]
MDSKQSKLSDPRCQADFVVATTQASINAGLLEYLDEQSQPVQYICFSQDERGIPSVEIKFEDLMKRTGGIDPFYIPDKTPSDDPRVQKLADTDFAVGLMLQMGIPEGFTPRTLPPIVTLNTASNVLFNLFCKQVKVVSLRFGRHGAIWNVFEQPKGPSGIPWSLKMSVDLTVQGLNQKLDTNYFNSHPKVKDQLIRALNNISGTAFSLQQLLFDLDNAVLETVPDFSGIDDDDAKFVLQNKFQEVYYKAAKEHGLPLVAVMAVAQPKDESTLQMTGFERIVNPLKDSNGSPVASPTDSQRAVTTLDHLCSVNKHPVPQISSLDWNWVQPQDVTESSGAIAINRDILAKYIASNLLKTVSSACYTARIRQSSVQLSSGGTPEVTFPSTGSNTIHMEYSSSTQGPQNYGEAAIDVTTQVVTKYTLDVFFVDATIRVAQSSLVYIACYLDAYPKEGYTMNIVDKALTDVYSLSVGQTGSLQLVKTEETPDDQSDTAPTAQHDPATTSGDDPIVQMVQAMIDEVIHSFVSQVLSQVLSDVSDSSAGNLHELQVSNLHNFVFPGARVFTYKEPFFSDYQDLVCKITYLDPNQVSPTQDPQEHQAHAPDQSPADDPAPSSPNAGTVRKLTACTDLMQNYVNGETISPSGKFEALQTSDGHSLLFAVDTSGVFHVIKEQSGISHTGWEIHDLSTHCIQTQFGQESTAKVRAFDVGQSAVDGTIGMMMAVNLDGNDHLLISLGNSSDDTSWVTDPVWVIVPFDPVNESRQKITIAGALFAASQDIQYLVVDIDRLSGNAGDSHITRYHINPTREDGHYWVKHDVTVDISTGEYQSVVGRAGGTHVDGIYTAGHTGNAPQLVYEPVIDWYGKAAPTPITLQLPQGELPTAIATAGNGDGSTDLYAVAGSTLYWFPADEQGEDFAPKPLCTSDLVAGTDTLRAMTHGGVTTLWGRSMGDEVYYLSCPTDQVGDLRAWKQPMPILSGVERMSSYVNCADGGNTIFAFGNGMLQKLVQGLASAGVWRPQAITIAAPPEQKSTSFRSYTTSFSVTNTDSDLPAGNALVNLSASTRTPVYINGLYYVLSSTPVQIRTDGTGSLTIIDATDSLHAAILTVSIDDAILTINPMDQTLAKLTDLNSAEKLRGAQFPSRTVAGGIIGAPGYTPLVDPSISDDDVTAVSQHLGVLKDAYTRAQGSGKTASNTLAFTAKHGQEAHGAMLRTPYAHGTNLFSLGDIWDDIKDVGDAIGGVVHDVGDIVGGTLGALAGDIFHGLKHAAETVGKIIQDGVTGTLHFFGKIGGKIYHAVLDTVHAIVSAAEWVYAKVKAGIQDVLRFVEMLFEWDDIRRSKDVMHNAIRLWMQHQVDYLPKAKDAFNENVQEVERRTNEWAKISDWSGLGEISQKSAGQSAADPNQGQTPQSKLFAVHYQNHAGQLKILGESPTMDAVEQLVSDLMRAVSQEAAVLEGVFSQLRQLINDFASLSVEQVLGRVAVILADAALSSVQVVVDALVTVLQDLAQSAITLLDTKIHVPVISDILNAIGVPDVSFLDLICWIAAVAFTVVFKAVEQSAPFPKDNDSVQALISAGSWEELETIFGQSDLSLKPQVPQSIQENFFKVCHGVSGFLCLIGNPVTSIDAAAKDGSSGVISKGATVIKFVVSGAKSIGDMLVPQHPLKNKAMKTVSEAASVLGLLSSVVFSSVAQSAFSAVGFGPLSVGNPRGLGSLVGVILIIPRLAVTGWHFYELTQDAAGDIRTAALLDEVSNLTSYASRISYAVATNDEDPDTRLLAVTAKAASDDLFAGLQVAETFTAYA